MISDRIETSGKQFNWLRKHYLEKKTFFSV